VCAVSIVCLEVFALFLRERERRKRRINTIDDVTRSSLVPEEFLVWFWDLASTQQFEGTKGQGFRVREGLNREP
jgi:transcriptional regulator of met regulon